MCARRSAVQSGFGWQRWSWWSGAVISTEEVVEHCECQSKREQREHREVCG